VRATKDEGLKTMAKKHTTKTPKDRSPKAHQPMPPKEIEPAGDVQGHERGEVGQFTGKAAPGLMKK
jgi:hypothetical protein